MPEINDLDKIQDEFQKYWNDQKTLALGKICEKENLDQPQFQALIESFLYSSQDPLRDDIFKCLDNRPSVLKAQEIGERILKKMKHFVDVYLKGLVA